MNPPSSVVMPSDKTETSSESSPFASENISSNCFELFGLSCSKFGFEVVLPELGFDGETVFIGKGCFVNEPELKSVMVDCIDTYWYFFQLFDYLERTCWFGFDRVWLNGNCIGRHVPI